MPPDAPTNLQPTDTEAGIYGSGLLRFQWTPLTGGTGVFSACQLCVYDDAIKTTTLYDSGMVPAQTGLQGDGWMERAPELMGLSLGAAVYWGVTVRDDGADDSAESSLTSFTLDAADLTAAGWLGAQT